MISNAEFPFNHTHTCLNDIKYNLIIYVDSFWNYFLVWCFAAAS